MDVNEHERITNIPLRHKVKEERLHCCSTLTIAVGFTYCSPHTEYWV